MAKKLLPADYAKAGTEHAHQVALFMWARDNWGTYPQLKRLHAIPNGGLRSKITAGRLKAEGVKEGVPDVSLPYPIQSHSPPPLRSIVYYAGLYVELKRPGNKKPDAEQDDWRAYLNSVHYRAVKCWGWVQASRAIVQYLSGEYPEQPEFVTPEQYSLTVPPTSII